MNCVNCPIFDDCPVPKDNSQVNRLEVVPITKSDCPLIKLLNRQVELTITKRERALFIDNQPDIEIELN